MAELKMEKLLQSHEQYCKQHPDAQIAYEVAAETLQRGIDENSSERMAKAVAILLMTWNMGYYYRCIGPGKWSPTSNPFNLDHWSELQGAIRDNQSELQRFRRLRLQTIILERERESVYSVFDKFATLCGPVGAAKALHLLAPQFFPLWDNAIARLVLGPDKVGDKLKAEDYWGFMKRRREEICSLPDRDDILKLVDEHYFVNKKDWQSADG
ncbi:MAG: hypothetical protein M1118_11360 [Chloroflexi bacterium]|nr:hypothetical protein [Chloroflexota bacterium]